MQEVKEITVKEFKALMDSGAEFQLIDVREPFEYDHSNLGGVPIPLGEILNKKDQISKDIPVVVQCRSGKRSEQAVRVLQNEGFQNLSNLKGGILAWKQEINPDIDVY